MRYPFHCVRARAVLARGGVVAYPTEGVWGLGCDPFNKKAVERLLALKGRPWQKGLIVALANERVASALLNALPPERQKTVKATWPGPNTWLLPHGDLWPSWVTGESDFIACRLSAYTVVRDLARAAGGAIISTSANPAGRAPAMTAQEVRQYFGRSVDFIMPGRVQGLQKPSVIRHGVTGEILRD
jgi:L-threonylcarbamoyladenylate synthase